MKNSAESLGSRYVNRLNEKHSGTIGNLGCLSFNGNKLITTGGGGAIIFKDQKLFKKGIYLASLLKTIRLTLFTTMLVIILGFQIYIPQ